MYKAIIKRWDGREHILLDSDRDYLEQFARFVVCKLEEEEHEVKSVNIEESEELKDEI